MNARHAAATSDCPPHGAVLISRVSGLPTRYQLTQYPSRAGIKATSAKSAWALARGFAAKQGVEVWFTIDGVSFSPAGQRSDGLGEP